jgi:AcrR family transcriptional regulator
MAKAEYRNAIRSRKLIKQAFLELMQEKDIDKISIKDIVTKADINRGTFYAHYSNTRAVIEQIENESIAAWRDSLDEFRTDTLIENTLPFLQKIGQFIEEDVDFCRLLLNAPGSITFINKLKALFMEKIVGAEQVPATSKKKQFLICANFFAYGYAGLIQEWLNRDLKISLNDLNLIISQTIKIGFQPFLSGRNK